MAFEAAQDCLFLVTSDNVDVAGARVRAFERLEHADWKGKVVMAMPEIAEGRDYPATIEAEIAHIMKDAEIAARFAPERAAEVRAALDDMRTRFQRPEQRKPSHWFGARTKIAQELGARLVDSRESLRQIMTYAHLSRYAHPRYRADAHQALQNPPQLGGLVPTMQARLLAVQLTEIGANILAIALNKLEGKQATDGVPLVPGSEPDIPPLTS